MFPVFPNNMEYLPTWLLYGFIFRVSLQGSYVTPPLYKGPPPVYLLPHNFSLYYLQTSATAPSWPYFLPLPVRRLPGWLSPFFQKPLLLFALSPLTNIVEDQYFQLKPVFFFQVCNSCAGHQRFCYRRCSSPRFLPP